MVFLEALATGASDNELEMAPTTGSIVSTCTEVELNSRRFNNAA